MRKFTESTALLTPWGSGITSFQEYRVNSEYSELVYKGWAFPRQEVIDDVFDIYCELEENQGLADWELDSERFDDYIEADNAKVLCNYLDELIKEFYQGVETVIMEAAYSYKYVEILKANHDKEDELDAFGGKDWNAHYALGVVASIEYLKQFDREDVKGTVNDEIDSETLIHDIDEDFVADMIVELIFGK